MVLVTCGRFDQAQIYARQAGEFGQACVNKMPRSSGDVQDRGESQKPALSENISSMSVKRSRLVHRIPGSAMGAHCNAQSKVACGGLDVDGALAFTLTVYSNGLRDMD